MVTKEERIETRRVAGMLVASLRKAMAPPISTLTDSVQRMMLSAPATVIQLLDALDEMERILNMSGRVIESIPMMRKARDEALQARDEMERERDRLARAIDCGALTNPENIGLSTNERGEDVRPPCLLDGGNICRECHIAGLVAERNTACANAAAVRRVEAERDEWKARAGKAEALDGKREISGAEVDAWQVGYRRGKIVHVELLYPRMAAEDGRADAVEIGLEDVRAADGILVSYDFERDGWAIMQASTFQWPLDDTTSGDPDWQEVAFVEAWGREKEEIDDDERCSECRARSKSGMDPVACEAHRAMGARL